MPTLAFGHPMESVLDRASLQGIKNVMVAPVMFENMENVKLTPEALQTAIQGKFRQASISLRLKGNIAPGSPSSEADRQDLEFSQRQFGVQPLLAP